MKNINRDHLVKVNAKTAEILEAPKFMSFYTTDLNTSNIFFQLTIDDTNSSFINAPTEDASNYKLTLRVVKPNNEPKEIEATLLNQSSNFFVADLTTDYIDVIGICECELFIETTINGRQEISTTEPFEYEVIESIFSSLDEFIKAETSLIDALATKDYVNETIENMYLTEYATRNYVNEALADLNLTSYATKDYVDQVLVGNDIDLSKYVTDEELAEALASIQDQLYDDTELRGLIDNKADIDHTHDNIWIGTQDEYDAITNIDPNVLYFIQEDEV